jgi:hypothetical protein
MIVDITQIKNPNSFMTCSKDKRVKIFTYNGDCLGEINTGSYLMNNNNFFGNPWNFKLNWEKLKLEEITEVMRIYQNVSGSNMVINERYNAQVENLNSAEDNFEERKKNKKNNEEIQIVRKKRFKPLEETKKDKIFVNYNDDADVKFDVKIIFIIIK